MNMITRLTIYFLLVGIFYWYCSSDGHLWNENGSDAKKINLSSVKIGEFDAAASILYDTLNERFEKNGDLASKELNFDILPKFQKVNKESL